MAVDTACRRQGVASAMLLAAERVAARWGEAQTLLHVYQDNAPAIAVYEAAGYDVIFQDAPWLAKLAVRPRFLMRKQFTTEEWIEERLLYKENCEMLNAYAKM
jgi:ribosomal protein S18 acetylase RimI-like enzyme